jgi:hypothetical protein
MIRRQYLLFIYILALAPSLRAQVVAPAGINSGGRQLANANLQAEFSIGELFIGTYNNGSVQLSQGLVQPTLSQSTLPVTGLDLNVRRLSAAKVQLNWTTRQEINNKGFNIERRKETEHDFAVLMFTPSKSQNGHSSFPLSYSHTDTNAFAGRTYYRLRQEDQDGRSAFSVVRMVNGNAEKAISIKAWPVPAIKEFSVVANGIEKDVLQLYNTAGRLVQQLNIREGERLIINNLAPGMYVIRLQSHPDMSQKVTVIGY